MSTTCWFTEMNCTVHLMTTQFEGGHSMDSCFKCSVDTRTLFGRLLCGMGQSSVRVLTRPSFNGQVSEVIRGHLILERTKHVEHISSQTVLSIQEATDQRDDVAIQ